MKGIAHFVTGVAIATFFPEVVASAAEGSLLPVLGGVAGIVPDTLDFKLVRYFEEYDIEIDPGPVPDPQEIAERVAGAMRRAYESGKPQSMMLHTIRLGPDQWRQYVVRFDPHRSEVVVGIGPIVDTGQVPHPGSELADAEEVRIHVGVPIVQTYDQDITVDIFSGPSFRFERRGDLLHVHFLDWHRRWSHSLTLAAALGLGAGGISALVQAILQGGVTRMPIWVGLVFALGLAGHILEDQLGFMGSNLFFPFTRARTRGLGLLRSGDAVPNFLTVWTGTMLILFNLDRFSARPRLHPAWFLGLAVALPLLLLGGVYRRQRPERSGAQEALRQQDIISDAERTEIG